MKVMTYVCRNRLITKEAMIHIQELLSNETRESISLNYGINYSFNAFLNTFLNNFEVSFPMLYINNG